MTPEQNSWIAGWEDGAAFDRLPYYHYYDKEWYMKGYTAARDAAAKAGGYKPGAAWHTGWIRSNACSDAWKQEFYPNENQRADLGAGGL